MLCRSPVLCRGVGPSKRLIPRPAPWRGRAQSSSAPAKPRPPARRANPTGCARTPRGCGPGFAPAAPNARCPLFCRGVCGSLPIGGISGPLRTAFSTSSRIARGSTCRFLQRRWPPRRSLPCIIGRGRMCSVPIHSVVEPLCFLVGQLHDFSGMVGEVRLVHYSCDSILPCAASSARRAPMQSNFIAYVILRAQLGGRKPCVGGRIPAVQQQSAVWTTSCRSMITPL